MFHYTTTLHSNSDQVTFTVAQSELLGQLLDLDLPYIKSQALSVQQISDKGICLKSLLHTSFKILSWKAFSVRSDDSPLSLQREKWSEAFDVTIPVATLCRHTSKTHQTKTTVCFCYKRKKCTILCSDTNTELPKSCWRTYCSKKHVRQTSNRENKKLWEITNQREAKPSGEEPPCIITILCNWGW